MSEPVTIFTNSLHANINGNVVYTIHTQSKCYIHTSQIEQVLNFTFVQVHQCSYSNALQSHCLNVKTIQSHRLSDMYSVACSKCLNYSGSLAIH